MRGQQHPVAASFSLRLQGLSTHTFLASGGRKSPDDLGVIFGERGA